MGGQACRDVSGLRSLSRKTSSHGKAVYSNSLTSGQKKNECIKNRIPFGKNQWYFVLLTRKYSLFNTTSSSQNLSLLPYVTDCGLAKKSLATERVSEFKVKCVRKQAMCDLTAALHSPHCTGQDAQGQHLKHSAVRCRAAGMGLKSSAT